MQALNSAHGWWRFAHGMTFWFLSYPRLAAHGMTSRVFSDPRLAAHGMTFAGCIWAFVPPCQFQPWASCGVVIPVVETSSPLLTFRWEEQRGSLPVILWVRHRKVLFFRWEKHRPRR